MIIEMASAIYNLKTWVFYSLGIVFLSSFTLPLAAYAESKLYYELNPDYYLAHPLSVSTSQNLYLYFQPQNDFLSGFDFWLDNVGPLGTVTISLHNDQGSVLGIKTVSINTLDPVPGGNKVHIDFFDTILVLNTKIYSIEIQSTMPDLRIYYINSVEILQHSSLSTNPYLTGVTKINNILKDFVLKFALYEADDTKAPQISNLLIKQEVSNSAIFSWNANEPIDYKIDYGLVGGSLGSGFSYQNVFAACTEGIATCSTSLAVEPDKTYSYSIGAKDDWGNQAFFTGQFVTHVIANSPPPTEPPPTTPPPPEPTPPPPPASTKFSIGDRARVISTVNVRSNPGTAAILLGTQNTAAMGTITGGPTNADNFSWWYVNYDNAPKGWSIEDNLQLVSPTAPPTYVTPQGGTAPPTPSSNSLPVTTTSSENTIAIHWTPGQGGGPASGYTVQITGENTGTQKHFVVSNGTHDVQFSELPEDTYTVTVAENTASGTKKVSEQIVTVKNMVQPKTGLSFQSFGLIWILPLLVLIILGAGLVLYKRRMVK